MNDEPKRYPADTPLTMGLLIEIYDSNGKKGPADFWRKQIELPKPEPEDGKWYLCEFVNGKRSVYLYKDDCWLSHTDDPPRHTAINLEKSIKVIAEMKEVAL